MTDKEIIEYLKNVREILEGYNSSKDTRPLDLEIHKYSIEWKQISVELNKFNNDSKSIIVIPNAHLVCEKYTVREILNNLIGELSSRSS